MTNERSRLQREHVYFLLLLAVGVSILFFQMIQGFVLALLLAAIAAALVRPFYTRAVAWVGGRESVAAGITIVLVLLMVVIPLLVFFGLVAHAAVEVSEAAVGWAKAQQQAQDEINRLLEKVPFLDKSQVTAKAGELAHKAAQFAAGELGGLTAGTAKFFLILFVFLYAKFQFLLSGPVLLDRVLSYLPLSDEEKRRTLNTFTSVTQATLIGAGAIGIIQGVLAGIAFAVAGIKGALFWTAIMAVSSLIPGIGVALVWVPAVIYLLVEGRYGAAIGLGLWCAIVVGSVDNFLRPVLVGKRTQLPNLLVLLGTLGGLMYFGPIGIILGPVVAALFLTIWELWASVVSPADLAGAESA